MEGASHFKLLHTPNKDTPLLGPQSKATVKYKKNITHCKKIHFLRPWCLLLVCFPLDRLLF